MGNTQKGMSDLFLAGTSPERLSQQLKTTSILAESGHHPLHTTTGVIGSTNKQGIIGHRYGEHSNPRYNTQTHQETHNSSHSFAARLTDSQLVINDPDDENATSSQKYKYTQPNKYKLSGFDSSLYKECDHLKVEGRVKTQPNRERAGISMAFDPRPDIKKRISDNNTNRLLRGQPQNPGKRKNLMPHLEDFDIIRVIGKGGFSTVFQVRRKDDGAIYAMKCLKKSQIKRENKVRHVMNERQILQTVNHPYIVKMKWAFQSEHYLFIILEFCAGGEIFYHMNKVLRFSEKVAKFYFAEIVLAMEYLHAKNIFYRDLKPENVLLDQDGHVKLADFGISRLNFGAKERSSSFCGSPEYMSPEMLKSSRIHGRSVDYYALGALLYEMLTGLPPHFSENRDEMYRKILHNTPDYPRYLSPMAKSLLKGLLIKNPEQRLGAKYGIQEIKDHPFCMDINWEDALQKKLLPPIRPSQKYSNFDPEYTSLPVRFTFEEDFVKSHHTRRNSDPCIELGLYSTPQKNQDSPSQCQGLGEIQQVFNNLGQAIVYPSFVHERAQFDGHTNKTPSSFKVSAHKNQYGHSDEIGEGSPNYSRPPSSTFRGYSFMNFRNDSISSADQNTNNAAEGTNQQSNQQSPETQKIPFSKPHPQQTNSQFQQSHQASQQFVTTQPQIGILNCQNLQNATHLKQQMSMSGPGKNVYSMQFKGFNNFFNEIQFKANEYEFNAFNHQFPKKWQMPANIVSKLRLDPKSLQQIIQNQNMLPPPVAQLTEQVLIQEAINNFDYRIDDPLHQRNQSYQWPNIVRNMPDIIEDIENEARYAESPRNMSYQQPLIDSNNITSALYTNPHSVLLESRLQSEMLSRNSADSLNEKVIQILQGDKETNLDQFTKNLIRFNDEINNVKTERKRKPLPTKNKNQPNQESNQQAQDPSQTINYPPNMTEDRRKGAQSLYTNLNPINVDNRIRIQSNYTTLSGDRLAEVTEIGSIRSGRKSNLKNTQISVLQTQLAQSIVSTSQSPPKKQATKESTITKGKSKASTMYGPNDQKQLLDRLDTVFKSPAQIEAPQKISSSRQVLNKSSNSQAFSPKTLGQKPSLTQSTSEQKYSSLMAQSIQANLVSPKQNLRIGSGQTQQFGDKKTSTPSNSGGQPKSKFIVNNQMSTSNIQHTNLAHQNIQQSQNVKSRNSASSQHLHHSANHPSSSQFNSDKKPSNQQNLSLLSLSVQNQNSVSGAKLKNTKLEQIDEFDILPKNHELSSSTVKIPSKQQQLASQINQDLLKPKKKISRLNSPKNILANDIVSSQKQATSTKGGIQLYQNSNNKLQVPSIQGISTTPNQTNRNRQKTSSQYVSNTTIGNNQFKGFFNTQDFHKVTQEIKAYESNPSQNKLNEDDIQNSQAIDQTNKLPPSKNNTQIKTLNKIPKSLEREAKVNGSSDDNTLEDVDENMDEFGVNDNQNIQRLKNVSLITSIALTNGKQLDFGGMSKDHYSSTFVRNSNFSASSSIISHSMHPPFNTQSNQRTPDEMNLHDLRESAHNLLNYHSSSKPLKTSPQQYLGDSSFLKEDDGVPQTEIYDSPKNSSLNLPNMNELDNYHTKQSVGAQGNSSLLIGSGGAASLAGYHSVNVHFASLLPTNGGGSIVLSPKLPAQVNRKQQTTYAQHSTPMGHQMPNRVDSPKPISTNKQQHLNQLPPSSRYHPNQKEQPKKITKSDNKYQFWNTKRNDQKSPSQNMNATKESSTSQQIDLSVKTPKTLDLYSAFEEVKNSVTERAETEVKISDDKEKILLCKSERKLKQSQKSNMTAAINSSQFSSSHSRNNQTASNSLNSNQNQKQPQVQQAKHTQPSQLSSPENHINFSHNHQDLHTHQDQPQSQQQFNQSSDNQVKQQVNNQKSQNSNSLSLRLTLSHASKNL